MDSVTHHGRETAYRIRDRAGSGPTICCIHGSGGSKDVWTAQSALADRFPVVSLDLSGHGESDDVNAEPGAETLAAYADDAIAVAEDTGASVLCGQSLGGAVAMWIAIERDVALEGLGLVGTGARLRVLQDLRDWLANDFERAVSFLHDENRLFHDPSEELLDRSAATMRRCGRDVVERDFLTCHRFDVRDRLGEVTAPATAIVGEHDRLTPPRYHDFLARELPDCTRVTIADAAHLAMIERPDTFNTVLLEFLDRIDDR